MSDRRMNEKEYAAFEKATMRAQMLADLGPERADMVSAPAVDDAGRPRAINRVEEAASRRRTEAMLTANQAAGDENIAGWSRLNSSDDPSAKPDIGGGQGHRSAIQGASAIVDDSVGRHRGPRPRVLPTASYARGPPPGLSPVINARGPTRLSARHVLSYCHKPTDRTSRPDTQLSRGQILPSRPRAPDPRALGTIKDTKHGRQQLETVNKQISRVTGPTPSRQLAIPTRPARTATSPPISVAIQDPRELNVADFLAKVQSGEISDFRITPNDTIMEVTLLKQRAFVDAFSLGNTPDEWYDAHLGRLILLRNVRKMLADSLIKYLQPDGDKMNLRRFHQKHHEKPGFAEFIAAAELAVATAATAHSADINARIADFRAQYPRHSDLLQRALENARVDAAPVSRELTSDVSNQSMSPQIVCESLVTAEIVRSSNCAATPNIPRPVAAGSSGQGNLTLTRQDQNGVRQPILTHPFGPGFEIDLVIRSRNDQGDDSLLRITSDPIVLRSALNTLGNTMLNLLSTGQEDSDEEL